jgi:putative endonuclease
MDQYYTYILFSEKLNRYYIGYTSDLQDRIAKHNRSLKGYTSMGKPWKLVYFESFISKSEAMQRETQLKSWKNVNRIKELIGCEAGSEHPD